MESYGQRHAARVDGKINAVVMPAGKFTQGRREKILGLARMGNYATTCAVASGVDERTLYDWLARGRHCDTIIDPDTQEERALNPVDQDYYEFAEEYARAVAEAEALAVGQIRKAGQEDWRAALAFLERRHGARWGRRDRHEQVSPESAEEEKEKAVLNDPRAVELMHEALESAARSDEERLELPEKSDSTES